MRLTNKSGKRISIWLIIKNELAYKKFGFLTGVLSLFIATAGFVGALILLRGDAL